MSTAYALQRTPEEYERLRAQARVWEAATGRPLDRVGLAPRASCLDAGCGPGETMRLMAQRVGPGGHVLGVDVDAPLGAQAVAMLHEAGHHHCDFAALDLTAGEPLPGAPSTSSTRDCCCTTFPNGSRCCSACGTRSLRTDICSSRTTTCTASA